MGSIFELCEDLITLFEVRRKELTSKPPSRLYARPSRQVAQF
jgi:hypothetical protein